MWTEIALYNSGEVLRHQLSESEIFLGLYSIATALLLAGAPIVTGERWGIVAFLMAAFGISMLVATFQKLFTADPHAEFHVLYVLCLMKLGVFLIALRILFWLFS
ncbi:MAG: hypothetical protein R3C11_00295 [Planctomycetaceae bacterium]